MGGEHVTAPDHLLVILPIAEPTALLDSIKLNHPHLKITFRKYTESASNWDEQSKIPHEIFHDATILATLSTLPPSLEDCPNLKYIHLFSAGCNHIAKSPIYTSTSIPLTTSSGVHGPQIAEWIILTALVHSHKYNVLHLSQLKHEWMRHFDNTDSFALRDKVGQRLGVLGYGSIGRQVGRVAQAMGMNVIAYTASPRPSPESKKDHGFVVPNTGDPDGTIPCGWFSGLDKASLRNFLSQEIDHLVVSVPLTNETRHFLAAPEFSILGKRNAFISNISRGHILQQDDLIAALKQGAINDGKDGGLGGAALDVTDPEPLPKDHPLWDAPNCIITPHISGLSAAYMDRAFRVLELNMKRWEEGKPLINLVDRKRGY